MRRVVLLAIALALGAVVSHDARADGDEETADSTPRATLRSFAADAHARHWKDAANAVDTEGRGPGGDLPQLARELAAVFDTYGVARADDLSDQPSGRLDDGLPANLEEIGRVPGSEGRGSSPVRMLRLPSGRWVFAPSTLAHVAGWYADLPDRWMRDHLPPPFFTPGPRGVLWWQYAALLILAMASLVVGALVELALRVAWQRLRRRMGGEPDPALLRRVRGPLTLFLATLAASLFLDWLLLSPPAATFVRDILDATRLIAIYWFLVKAVDLAAGNAHRSKFFTDRPQSASLIPLASRATKIALSIVAGVVALQKLGYPAASLIAGLGIGGLAFALAAQKTVENLFGSVMLSVDQPFRVGDLVKTDSLQGVVESVGLRSTRIRTADRTTLTVPNGKLADMAIECFATRDRLKFQTTVQVVYGTSAAQLRRIMDELKAALETHPKRHPEAVRVALSNLGASSIDIEVIAWFATTDFNEFVELRQQTIFAIMEIVAKHGSDFAFPTQTLHVASVPAAKATKS